MNRNRNASQYHQRPAFANQQHQPSPAQANPFVPLQASRKATKAKNIQTPDVKKVAQPKQAKQKEATSGAVNVQPETPASAQKTNATVGISPAVDKRKSRLAISFGK